VWSFVTGKNDIYYGNNVGVGTGMTIPAYTMDISGDLQVINNSRLNKITEKIGTGIVSNNATSITVDYSNNSIFYVGNTIGNAFTSNFTINVNNMRGNALIDPNRTYVITLLYDYTPISTNRGYYGNVIRVSETSGTYTNCTVYYLNGSASVSVDGSANLIIQQLSFMNCFIGSPFPQNIRVINTINSYKP
jgi:hypothetical protein